MAGFSSFCQRIQGDGAAAWDIHMQAQKAVDRGEDVIVMSVGDPDMDTPAAVVEAAVDSLRGGDTHYVDVMGKESLRQAIALRHQEGTGQKVGADQVMVFSGTQNALFASLFCLAEQGDEVIIIEPAYVTYEASVGATGADLVRVATDPDKGFAIDIDALAEAVTSTTKVILLCSPNNPTGRVMTQAELEAVADLAIKYDLWLICDDVYGELVYAGDYVAMASIDRVADRLVTISSLSKSHAMSGWRTGWAIAPQQLINHFYNVSLTMLYGLPGFVQQGAKCALTDAWQERLRMREVYARRKQKVMDLLGNLPGVSPLEPQAGMFILVDIRDTGLSSQEFVEQLYRQQRVSVLSAAAFGACAEGFVRISFALDDARLEAGIDRLRAFVNGL